MSVWRTICFGLTLALTTSALAELNTTTYVTWDGLGEGRVEGDLSGVGEITLYDGEGGDMWDGGDQFIYRHDENRITGDFTATARVVAQTESVEGRWGKAGVLATAELDGLSQAAMAQVYSGTGSQVDPPASDLEHSPVPVRIGGRTGTDGTGGFEIGMSNSSGEIPNNVFPETTANVLNPETNVSWIRLQYKADTNSFIAGFAPDVEGSPGEWGYSPVQANVPASADGWYLGLAYSAHNSLLVADLEDEQGMHGITFDNYSMVPEYLAPQVQVGGLGIGSLSISGTLTNVEKGEPQEQPGLSQFWYAGNMRANPEAFLEAGDTGSEAFPLIFGGGAFTTDTTWWSGSQGQPVSDLTLQAYPPQSGAPEDNYSVRLTGEIFILADGEYAIMDGIDDYTLIAVDLDGNGTLDGLDDLSNADVTPDGEGAVFDDIVVHDDDWSNIDGGDNPFTGFAEFENIGADGEWRSIEIWMSEAGGGDGGIVYAASSDDPNLWDDLALDALTPEQRDAFVIRQEQLRTTVAPITGGESSGALRDDVEYILSVGPDGNDQIAIDDSDGVLTTTLDVAGATVTVSAAEDTVAGSEFQLFDVDSVVGSESLSLQFADPSQWDLSRLSEGIIVFGSGPLCDPNTQGDLDGDGTVAFADFLILSNNFGTSVDSHEAGDIDCDGTVAFADFLVLSNNFGQSVGANSQAVPEPSGFAMFGFASLACCCLARMKRRSRAGGRSEL